MRSTGGQGRAKSLLAILRDRDPPANSDDESDTTQPMDELHVQTKLDGSNSRGNGRFRPWHRQVRVGPNGHQLLAAGWVPSPVTSADPAAVIALFLTEAESRCRISEEEGTENLKLFRMAAALHRWRSERKAEVERLLFGEDDGRSSILLQEAAEIAALSRLIPVSLVDGPFMVLVQRETTQRLDTMTAALEMMHQFFQTQSRLLAITSQLQSFASSDEKETVESSRELSELIDAVVDHHTAEMHLFAMHSDSVYVRDERGSSRCCIHRLISGVRTLSIPNLTRPWYNGFHCTKTIAALNAILHDGFDPSRRCGQCYGRGEYFSLNMHVALEYNAIRVRPVICAIVVNGPHLSKLTHVVVDNDPSWETSFCAPMGYLIPREFQHHKLIQTVDASQDKKTHFCSACCNLKVSPMQGTQHQAPAALYVP